MSEYDLAVIGGGAGGLVVTSVAARLGLRVALIERGTALGGDCLHTGCVPSKTLIHTARVAHRMRHASAVGLPAVEPEVDLGAVNRRIAEVVARIQAHDSAERFRGYGAEVIFGAPRFTGRRELDIDGRSIRARRFVIATGSRPLVPAIDGLETIDHLTNERAYDLPALPSRLAVLGAGPVGVELAQAFARLGSRVTLIEQAEHPLPQEDPEIAERLREVLEADGLTVRTGARVERVHRAGDATRLAGPGGLDVEADAVLIAVGRRPNVEDLDLEAAGVTYSSAGIEVDRRQRTANRRIYACGDVCGPYAFTHVAEHQAGIVLANAVFRLPRKTDYSATPWVVFTDPELARVGLTEGQARARGLEPKVMRLELGGLDRALTEAEERGLVKLVTHRDRLLGASLLAPRAGELVHEIVLGMRLGARARDISAAIHAYPTYAQAHRRAVNEAYAERLFAPATRRLVRWLNRLLP